MSCVVLSSHRGHVASAPSENLAALLRSLRYRLVATDSVGALCEF